MNAYKDIMLNAVRDRSDPRVVPQPIQSCCISFTSEVGCHSQVGFIQVIKAKKSRICFASSEVEAAIHN